MWHTANIQLGLAADLHAVAEPLQRHAEFALRQFYAAVGVDVPAVGAARAVVLDAPVGTGGDPAVAGVVDAR